MVYYVIKTQSRWYSHPREADKKGVNIVSSNVLGMGLDQVASDKGKGYCRFAGGKVVAQALKDSDSERFLRIPGVCRERRRHRSPATNPLSAGLRLNKWYVAVVLSSKN